MTTNSDYDEEEPDPEHIKERIFKEFRQPILLVEINLTDICGQVSESVTMETIIVFEGDRAETLARDFARQHNLSLKIQTKLQGMLET